MSQERKPIHEFFKHQRSAKAFDTSRGIEIDFYENYKFVRTLEVFDRSEEYVCDVMENWCYGIIPR